MSTRFLSAVVSTILRRRVKKTSAEPPVVGFDSSIVSGATGGTTAATAAMALKVFVSYPDPTITPNSTEAVRGTAGGLSDTYFYVTQTAGQIQIPYFDGAGVAQVRKFNLPFGMSVDEPVELFVIGGSGAIKTYFAKAGDTSYALLDDYVIPTGSTFAPGAQTWSVGNSATASKLQDLSGVLVWSMDAVPSATLADIFAASRSPGGRRGVVADMEAIFGIPRLNWGGPAADVLLNKGSGADFTSSSGTFTNKAVAEVAPAGSFVLTSDSDASLLDGTYYAALTDEHVFNLGATDKDYSAWSVTVDRSSVVTGESVYLKVVGPTEEEKATWGFLWEFDTTGEFQHLSTLPWHMRQKNRATGHHQTAAWETPGIKTVKVRVVPPSWLGIKGAVLTVTVENKDPDVVFSGRTAVLSLGNVFTGAPAGQQFTDLASAWNFIKTNKGGRLRVKRGETIPVSGIGGAATTADYQSGVMIDDWGDAAASLPLMDVSGSGFNWRNGNYVAPYYLLRNLHFKGAYNGLNGDRTSSQSAVEVTERTPFTAHGCKFDHIHIAISGVESVSDTAPYYKGSTLSVWDCLITHWENFGIWSTRSMCTMFRGSYIAQDPAIVNSLDGKAWGSAVNYPDHGPFRQSFGENCAFVFSQLQLASFNGWSAGSLTIPAWDQKVVAHQALTRIASKFSEGANVLISECYGEGGGYLVGGGQTGSVVGAGFGVIQGCYHFVTANWNSWSIGMTGVTVRDNVIICPSVPREDSNSAVLGGINYPEGPSSDPMTAAWPTKPVSIYNNTFVLRLQPSHTFTWNGGAKKYKFTEWLGGGSRAAAADAPEISFRDNLIWVTDYAFADGGTYLPDGIYATTGGFGPNPRYEGRRQLQNDGTVKFDSQYASPAGSQTLALLSGTSSLKGSLGGTVPRGALDCLGRIRPNTSSPGAIEPEVLKPA